jgi:carboxymethylenebutenolidase
MATPAHRLRTGHSPAAHPALTGHSPGDHPRVTHLNPVVARAPRIGHNPVMCFDHDSHPPIVPIAGGSLDAREIVLEAAGGSPFAAYLARAAVPSGAGIVILPDVRGLHAYYRELSLRFAEHGVDAIAIDYFGRTAGLTDRGPAFDFAPHVRQTTHEGLRADTTAAAAHLRGAAGVRSLFTIGFCMGGRLAFLSAGFGLGLAGVIGFYGWPTGPSANGTPAPADVAATFDAPVLSIFGGADERIGPEARDEWASALADAGIQHESQTYDHAPHSFFDRKEEEFAAESADAWARTLGFIRARTEG